MLITLIVMGSIGALAILFAYLYRAPDLSEFDVPQATLLVGKHEISDFHQSVVTKITDYVALSDPKLNIHEQRVNMENLMGCETTATIAPVDVGGVSGEWVIAEEADPDKRLLYLHGGAFRLGSQVQLDVWPKLVHVFQAFEGLPESNDALQRAAEFIGGH